MVYLTGGYPGRPIAGRLSMRSLGWLNTKKSVTGGGMTSTFMPGIARTEEHAVIRGASVVFRRQD